MTAIARGVGVTPSEKYLASLADRAFLNLWSYPNLFIDRRVRGKGDGKELCDLLVICGNDVLIFSDKSVAWPEEQKFQLAWCRWYRRAIEKSVAQIGGAERWLAEYPNRIFLDPACTQRLPIDLPSAESRRVHGIIVALGATKACAAHYKCSDGSFLIVPDLKGAGHTDPSAAGYAHFGIGDVRPDGSFIHVFNDQALDLLMNELDTLTDFVQYLLCREQIIRSGILMPVSGEHELLGQYLLSAGPEKEHGFFRPDGGSWKQGERLLIPGGTFIGLAQHPGYLAKKKADLISYAWDRMIEQFSSNILAGTCISPFGKAPKAGEAEQALRSMALESRVQRRLLGNALVEALKRAEEEATDRFVRLVLPGPSAGDRKLAYVFLILAYPKFPLKGGYEQYRRVRVNILHAYCLHTLYEHRSVTRVVGIALDASSKVTGRTGGSEDLIGLEIFEWTSDMEKEVQELKERFDIMRPGRPIKSYLSADEFPQVGLGLSNRKMSRRQRRAEQRAHRKAIRLQIHTGAFAEKHSDLREGQSKADGAGADRGKQ
jgi:hypothetical protein